MSPYLAPVGTELFQKPTDQIPGRFMHLDYIGSFKRNSQGTSFRLKLGGLGYQDLTLRKFALENNILQNYNVPQVKNSLQAEITGLRKYDRDNYSKLPYNVFHFYENVKACAPWVLSTRRFSYGETVARLNLSTSCGYPLNGLFRNKRDWLIQVDINQEMALYEEWVLSTQTPITLWSSFLKDEVVPKRKIHEPRQINCPGIHYLILFSSFVLDFNDQFVAGWSRSDSTHAVGIDVRSFDWHILMERVLQHPYDLSIDHKSFDATIHRSWFTAICIYRMSLMDLTPREKKLMEKCYGALRDSHVILCNGDIYHVRGGNMSGSPTTTEDNCMVNAASNHMCLSLLDVEYSQTVYGDDALITVSKPVQFSKFAQMKADLGMVVKAEFSCDLIDQGRVSFLSRSNRVIDGFNYSISSNPDKLLASCLFNNTRDIVLQFVKLCAIREVLFGCEPHFTYLDNVIRSIILTYSFPPGVINSHYRSRKTLLFLRSVRSLGY